MKTMSLLIALGKQAKRVLVVFFLQTKENIFLRTEHIFGNESEPHNVNDIIYEKCESQLDIPRVPSVILTTAGA